MKRKVLLIILLLLSFCIGVLLLADKLFFHFIFITKPGSCLILEEKYCKTGQLVYDEGKGTGYIKYNVSKLASVFAPIEGNYMLVNSKTINKGRIFIINSGLFEDSESQNTEFQVRFEGDFVKKIEKNSLGRDSKVSKGLVIGRSVGGVIQLSINNLTLNNENQVVSVLDINKLNEMLSNAKKIN
jgi:hypothetical protein